MILIDAQRQIAQDGEADQKRQDRACSQRGETSSSMPEAVLIQEAPARDFTARRQIVCTPVVRAVPRSQDSIIN